jgi:hypothetical protein
LLGSSALPSPLKLLVTKSLLTFLGETSINNFL